MDKIKWADVAHYYLKSGITMRDVGRFKEYHPDFVAKDIMDLVLLDRGDIQLVPILRHLEDMTEGERKELWRVVFSTKTTNHGRITEVELDFKGRTQFIKSTGCMTFDRWVMTQGLQRMGIQMNGVIWADDDLHNIDHSTHAVTHWLISKGFDVFGLIESGQAERRVAG